ncbi:MAG TPA: hypothetical protein VGB77_12820 [Abditibacteriaceae bacterium]|jgi:hypothetical protein
MSFLSKQERTSVYRRALATNPEEAQKAVGRAQTRLHGQLARTQSHGAANVSRLEEIVTVAARKHKDLQRQIPELARKADSAVGEERTVLHRNYLQAVQNAHRCAQIHDTAKRELIIAQNQ